MQEHKRNQIEMLSNSLTGKHFEMISGFQEDFFVKDCLNVKFNIRVETLVGKYFKLRKYLSKIFDLMFL